MYIHKMDLKNVLTNYRHIPQGPICEQGLNCEPINASESHIRNSGMFQG